jgi:hypothetical protein
MVVAALGSGNDNNYTAAPSGMTLRLEDVGGGVQGNYQTTLGLDGCVGIADKIQASIGGSGTLTNTQDTATAWATVLFALTEEVAAGHPAMRRIGMPMYGVGGVRVQ